jgi:hypothetical protein
MKPAIERLFGLMRDKAMIEYEIRTLKHSDEYKMALHQIIDQMPEVISINYRTFQRFMARR